jgi:two-component system, OmpR family, sensor histidine kinase SenX3
MSILIAALVGGVVGVAIGWIACRPREARSATVPEHESVPADSTPVGIAATPGPTWASVVDGLTLGVAVMARDGEVRYRNVEATQRAGTHTGILIDDAVKTALRRALSGEHSRRTLELYGPPEIAVVIAAEPLPDGSAVATIEDVSERRRLDAVRTDFVANISHELKTPVGALAVLAEALADESDPDVVQRVAARLVEESMRVARTIDDLMELSRIELGESPITEAVDIADVVAGGIERAAALAEARDIDVAVLDLPESLRVSGDRRQLVSALGNLVENAVKYSEIGGRVQIRANAQGGFAELLVADQGIGIPASEHSRIFERFYRVDKARSRDTGGTGLGLSIVRHVATNHGGEVLVSSREGEGSTFVLRIPLAKATLGPSDPNRATTGRGAPTS